MLRSLVHNLLVGRSLHTVVAVAEAHLTPPERRGAAALAQDLKARVSSEGAAAAVMRMVLVAAQQPSLPDTMPARSAFETYCALPGTTIKLASARYFLPAGPPCAPAHHQCKQCRLMRE